MLARREEEYDYEPLVAEPAPQLEEAKEPLIRREVNTNLRNCLRALFFLIAFGAMVVTLLGGIGAKNGYTLLDTQQRADQLEQENERLKIEIAQLKSPSRIEAIAVEQLHMQVPQNMYFSHEGE
ncbi:cell division protein FtsL [Selenomonas sp. oral taxon 892]|jgi:cell division protein ftsL|uniref:cell division protein FtsL n=1 Tax=Selenomonas sp. oral taxon 892 TaxID=1321785 RepID=UPI0003ACE33E|nr:cell division protein FtsL [Selenomonas sp. oral taxon 892]ERJ95387.1 putative cell division protein FtsL [Selenomonas sp. oral taxon 892 str. F0426]